MQTSESGTLPQGGERGESILRKATAFPDRVLAHLPPTLAGGASFFDAAHERGVFAMGALSVIGGILSPGVDVLHRDGLYSTDVYTCIVAPASSGKGSLKWARRLGRRSHEDLRSESEERRDAYDSLSAKERIGVRAPTPRAFFVPGNSGATRFTEMLSASGGRGVVFEEEIDTIASATGQEWGDYTDVLRKAYHHEPIAIARADRVIEIDAPRLSVCMSGTPGQFVRLMQSAENGLFSRFLYMPFVSAEGWRTQRPTETEYERALFFREASARLAVLHRDLAGRARPMRASLSAEQWDAHDHFWGRGQEAMRAAGYSDELVGNVRRAGIAACRIAALLTALRIADDGFEDLARASAFHVTDADFDSACEIAAFGLQGAFVLHALLSGTELPDAQATAKNAALLAALPADFGRADLLAASARLGVSDRTAYRIRDAWIESGHVAPSGTFGRYRRTSTAAAASTLTPDAYRGDGAATTTLPGVDAPSVRGEGATSTL